MRQAITPLALIDYDTKGFGIELVEADNLCYDRTYVHKTCNLWIRQLETSIQEEVRFRFQ